MTVQRVDPSEAVKPIFLSGEVTVQWVDPSEASEVKQTFIPGSDSPINRSISGEVRATFLARELTFQRIDPPKVKVSWLFFPRKWRSKESIMWGANSGCFSFPKKWRSNESTHLRRYEADFHSREVTVLWINPEAKSGRLSFSKKWRYNESIHLRSQG